MNSFVGYESPELIEGMKVSLNSISQSSGDFYSYSITYKTENINSALSCLLYTSPSPRDAHESRMPSSA